ncbi:C39 family peptidase [Micromonospora sp. NPDC049559]|uniref:C39 family peptidase n=1 Tax=Micromonospora sp. NPDC049559 TaxID=3155923 RepID=UPI00341FD6F7
MTTFSRWLPAITQAPVIRRSALGLAGLAFVGGAVAGPAVAAQAAPATPATQSVVMQDRHDDGKKHDDKKHEDDKRHDSKPSAKELGIRYQAQPNFYYCGPASTRIALTADGHELSQDDVAKKLGTTEAGTNSAEDTTRVLNEVTGGHAYKTTAIPDSSAKPAQMDKLQADVKNAIDNNRAVVANIIGTATDTDGVTHSYEGGHYLAVVGYRDDGRAVKIADPANPNNSSYWMSTIDMANWIATRGYSS